MCGICGIYNYKNTGEVDKNLLEKMTKVLAHRGPDGEGLYFNEKKTLGFGHRRLAIIDVEGGHQPMSNEAGSIWITYNGEIYNFHQLKKDLEMKGYRFRTHSDTEVLIYLYEEYDEDMLNKLNGIFAFTIWDEKKRCILSARDHYGVKPIYYYDNGKTFVFSSELKAILLNDNIRREVDLEALDMCLTFRHTPSPYTLIKGIKRLEPGSFIKIINGQVVKKQYFGKIPEINRQKGFNDWVEDLTGKYDEAIKLQMISDVPIGISLSGGVDSGTILSIMSDYGKSKVNAFTVGFESADETNEIGAARQLSNMFSAGFESQLIKQSDYVDFFDRYIWHMEEPVGNESALAYYFVAKLAQGNVKVLLNGQGADEPFAGYFRHLGEKYSYLFRPFGLMSNMKCSNERVSRMLYSLPEADMRERIYKVYSIITDKTKKEIYSSEMRNVFSKGRARKYIYDWVENRSPMGSALEKMLYIDTRTSLADNLLLAEDKMSMACSIEARVPFLDREVMKVVESIPGKFKISGLTQKYIHKKVCEKFLPKDIVYKKKIGFSNPMDIWLSSNLGQVLGDYIKKEDSLTKRYLNVEKIFECVKLHQDKKADYKRLLFLLLSLEKWYRMFILKETGNVYN